MVCCKNSGFVSVPRFLYQLREIKGNHYSVTLDRSKCPINRSHKSLRLATPDFTRLCHCFSWLILVTESITPSFSFQIQSFQSWFDLQHSGLCSESVKQEHCQIVQAWSFVKNLAIRSALLTRLLIWVKSNTWLNFGIGSPCYNEKCVYIKVREQTSHVEALILNHENCMFRNVQSSVCEDCVLEMNVVNCGDFCHTLHHVKYE